MSLFIRELSLYKKVLTLSLRVWTSTTLSNSLSRGLSLFLRVQTLRYRVIESRRVLFFTVKDKSFASFKPYIRDEYLSNNEKST